MNCAPNVDTKVNQVFDVKMIPETLFPFALALALLGMFKVRHM